MEIVFQDHLTPEQILHSLVIATNEPFTRVKIAVAYTTLAGSQLLVSRFRKNMGDDAFDSGKKSIITSLDHGTTEPAALRFWRDDVPNSEVRIYEASTSNTSSAPTGSIFHVKFFCFERPNHSSVLVGSANLTRRALTTNVELMTKFDIRNSSKEISGAWDRLAARSSWADEALIAEYEKARKKLVVPEIDSPIPHTQTSARNLSTLAEVSTLGLVTPDSFNNLWVQTSAMTGGSRNQLELPRGANSFFGFRFDQYGATNEVIGSVVLKSGTLYLADRKLVWEGKNQMERIHLPTVAQGGVEYTHKAILFRRLDDNSFCLIVEDWDSHIARSWRNASIETGFAYRLGTNSTRICGFF